MRTLPSILLFLCLPYVALSSVSVADEPNSTSNFATVNLFFLNQFIPEPMMESQGRSEKQGDGFEMGGEMSGMGSGMGGMGGGMGGMGGGMGGMGGQMQLHFETARVFLNDRYVGDVLFRHADARPKLNLPAGEIKVRIESDGYINYERTLNVLANGSVQWLVVKLERVPKPDSAKATLKKATP